MAYKRNPRSEIRTKMKFIFVCSVAVVTSRTLKSAELGDLGSKLRKLDQYQAETGIDDAKRDEIWNTTMANCTYITVRDFSIFEPVIPMTKMFAIILSTSNGYEKLPAKSNGTVRYQRRSQRRCVAS